MAGQRLFRPPNVSGWDEERWLDTSSFRGRWYAAAEVIERRRGPEEDRYDRDETPQQAVDKALAYWGEPGADAGDADGADRTSARRSRAPIDRRLAAAAPTAPCARTRCALLIANSPTMQAS